MAYCDSLLKNYDNNTKLSNEKRDILKEKRDGLGEIIKDYFSEKNYKSPDFKGQGSFTMRTIINPKEEDDLYDIDYGVYINKKDLEKDDGTLKSSFTAQNWIKSAIDKYIEDNADNNDIEEVKHKNKCIRVIYKKESSQEKYHVDLPVYYKDEDVCYLAVKDKASEDNAGWEESDPRAIVDWFREEIKEENKGEQFRRVVRYFKNWTALQNWNTMKPTGLLWTTLTSKYFNKADGNDDIALLETAKDIKDFLNKTNPILKNPINNDEDLLEKYSESAIKTITEKLEKLINKGTEAFDLPEEKQDEAEDLWEQVFTDIDSVIDNSLEDKALITSSPAILGNDNRSA